MDYLAASGLEPQLAIPVIVVVVGALLVYVFGFQKSEEPSLEHLAVLQSTSSYKARSVSNMKSKNVSAPSKAKEKPSQNGHVVHDKERNGGVANKNKKDVASNNNNKENKPPRTPQTPATSSRKVKQEVIRPEDFDSGEWIQATSRKDKKKQVKKDEPKENVSESPKKTKQETKEPETVVVDRAAEETILKEAQVQVQIQNQTTQTTPKPSPEKKGKKAAGKDASTATGSSGPSSQEASPSKQAAKKPEKKAPEVVKVNGVAPAAEEIKPASTPTASPVKKQSISEDAPAQEPQGRVAFDEMGETTDAWEEAKSRGNKKRRARKD